MRLAEVHFGLLFVEVDCNGPSLRDFLLALVLHDLDELLPLFEALLGLVGAEVGLGFGAFFVECEEELLEVDPPVIFLADEGEFVP